MSDQVQLKYQTSKTVNLDVLAVHGLAEPDHLVKFPGITHEFLDGSLAEQNAGARRNGTIDFQVMSDLNLRKAVAWWLDPLRKLVCLATAPTLNAIGSILAGGTLTNGSTYYYRVAASDIIGLSAASGQQSASISDPDFETIPLTWNAITGARKYPIWRKKDSGHWFLIDYSRTNSYTDSGAVADGDGWDLGSSTFPTALTSASEISVITDGDFELKWLYDTEYARMLSVPFRETTIFLNTDPFPV